MGASPYLTTARAIADDLASAAVASGTRVSWDGDDLVGTRVEDLRVVHGPVGPALYGGTAGIGWFLGHLAATTGGDHLASLARATLRGAAAELREDQSPALSLFSGLCGVAWACVDVGDRLGDADLRSDGLALARRIVDDEAALLDTTAEWDLLGGLAGVVIGLLAIDTHVRQAWLLDAARAAVARLSSQAREEAFGVAWPDPSNPDGPALCGLGHGASGAAWALAECAWADGDSDLPRLVDEALRHERGWFSPEQCAWADLRDAPGDGVSPAWPAWTAAWCHGAFGIGALRWRLYERTHAVEHLAEASAAIEAARAFVVQARRALRDGHATDVTLCHGVGGAIELMLLAYEVTGERDHLLAARHAGDLCLAIRAANGGRWTVGLRHARTVPGLFTGIAGIGVTMLRLHDVTAMASPVLPGRMRPAGGSG